ncbi:4'-phosphopantetheinyl transferase superfamily protein [Candidatus Woesearchaeota archaeon]|nr:4'-phosphopantetheinyl transferase superfamily protein [Candidatus Woesearchaeota archaeon]
MVASIGIDIEKVARFKKICSDKNFMELVFTKNEIAYCNFRDKPYIHFAGRFCAKEAIIKAYPKKIHFKSIEICSLASGKLQVKIKKKINHKIMCSISHTDTLAIAFAVMVR